MVIFSKMERINIINPLVVSNIVTKKGRFWGKVLDYQIGLGVVRFKLRSSDK